MDKINDVLTFKVRKRTKKYVPKKDSKEVRRFKSLKHVFRKIKTGDFDPNNVSHKIFRDCLIKEGYIDKDLNILKEIE